MPNPHEVPSTDPSADLPPAPKKRRVERVITLFWYEPFEYEIPKVPPPPERRHVPDPLARPDPFPDPCLPATTGQINEERKPCMNCIESLGPSTGEEEMQRNQRSHLPTPPMETDPPQVVNPFRLTRRDIFHPPTPDPTRAERLAASLTRSPSRTALERSAIPRHATRAPSSDDHLSKRRKVEHIQLKEERQSPSPVGQFPSLPNPSVTPTTGEQHTVSTPSTASRATRKRRERKKRQRLRESAQEIQHVVGHTPTTDSPNPNGPTGSDGDQGSFDPAPDTATTAPATQPPRGDVNFSDPTMSIPLPLANNVTAPALETATIALADPPLAGDCPRNDIAASGTTADIWSPLANAGDGIEQAESGQLAPTLSISTDVVRKPPMELTPSSTTGSSRPLSACYVPRQRAAKEGVSSTTSKDRDQEPSASKVSGQSTTNWMDERRGPKEVVQGHHASHDQRMEEPRPTTGKGASEGSPGVFRHRKGPLTFHVVDALHRATLGRVIENHGGVIMPLSEAEHLLFPDPLYEEHLDILAEVTGDRKPLYESFVQICIRRGKLSSNDVQRCLVPKALQTRHTTDIPAIGPNTGQRSTPESSSTDIPDPGLQDRTSSKGESSGRTTGMPEVATSHAPVNSVPSASGASGPTNKHETGQTNVPNPRSISTTRDPRLSKKAEKPTSIEKDSTITKPSTAALAPLAPGGLVSPGPALETSSNVVLPSRPASPAEPPIPEPPDRQRPSQPEKKDRAYLSDMGRKSGGESPSKPEDEGDAQRRCSSSSAPSRSTNMDMTRRRADPMSSMTKPIFTPAPLVSPVEASAAVATNSNKPKTSAFPSFHRENRWTGLSVSGMNKPTGVQPPNIQPQAPFKLVPNKSAIPAKPPVIGVLGSTAGTPARRGPGKGPKTSSSRQVELPERPFVFRGPAKDPISVPTGPRARPSHAPASVRSTIPGAMIGSTSGAVANQGKSVDLPRPLSSLVDHAPEQPVTATTPPVADPAAPAPAGEGHESTVRPTTQTTVQESKAATPELDRESPQLDPTQPGPNPDLTLDLDRTLESDAVEPIDHHLQTPPSATKDTARGSGDMAVKDTDYEAEEEDNLESDNDEDQYVLRSTKAVLGSSLSHASAQAASASKNAIPNTANGTMPEATTPNTPDKHDCGTPTRSVTRPEPGAMSTPGPRPPAVLDIRHNL